MPVHIQLVIYLAIVSTVFSIGLGIMVWHNRQREKEYRRRLDLAETSIHKYSKHTEFLAETASKISTSMINLSEAMTEIILAKEGIIDEIEGMEQKEREAQALFASAWSEATSQLFAKMPKTSKYAEGIIEIEFVVTDKIYEDEEDKERGEEDHD